MRHKIKRYRYEDVKIIKKFLIIPRIIDDEFRWLEIAYIEMRYGYYGYWKYNKWSTKEEYIKFKKVESGE